MTRARAVLWFATFGVLGCDEFDPALYERAELSAREGSDVCREADVPLLASSSEFTQLDLAKLDDSWQAANCGGGRAPGNDGFFAVDMEQGQKFHFHVNALDEIDPILYVVDSCDERVCQPLNSASCPGSKEHLSFLAPRTGRYYVGVDSTDPGGGNVELLAISPLCSDAEKQHSEACDDGNLAIGDGCDAFCRIEIPRGHRLAVEPNDDLPGANVLEVGALPVTLSIRGVLEGPCDLEFFSFSVPSAAEATVRVLSAAGAPCTKLNPELQIELQLLSGLISVADGQATEDNACPSLPAYALLPVEDPTQPPWQESTYHLRLRSHSPPDAPPLEYVLEIDLAPR